MFRKHVAGGLAAALGLVLATQGVMPAQAATASRTDPRGDAIARLDITQVFYRNAPHRIVGRITVPELERRGSAYLDIAKYATDTVYRAKVRIGRDGRLHKSFWMVDDRGVERRPCTFDATWSARNGRIRISVPQCCIRQFDTRPAYVRTHTGPETGGDHGPVVTHLRRG